MNFVTHWSANQCTNLKLAPRNYQGYEARTCFEEKPPFKRNKLDKGSGGVLEY